MADKRTLKYLAIKNALISHIQEQGLKKGDQIYSLSEIMDHFKVSKVTAVRALTEMENEGYVMFIWNPATSPKISTSNRYL